MKRELEANCPSDKRYFAQIQKMYENEDFLFVQTDVSKKQGERHDIDSWFPHRIQLQIRYWQRKTGGQFLKRLVRGTMFMGEYQTPEAYGASTVRGHEYDLRITLVPVTWVEVLDEFALDLPTYLIIYVLVDLLLIFVAIILWASMRISTRSANPPRLHFSAWLKGFELNPTIGFMMVAVPISIIGSFLKLVMLDIDPFASYYGDWAYIGEGTTAPDKATLKKWLFGRIGIMLLCLGFILMRNGSEFLCPRKDMPGSIWRPGFLQRRHVLYTSIWLFIILLLSLRSPSPKYLQCTPFSVCWRSASSGCHLKSG